MGRFFQKDIVALDCSRIWNAPHWFAKFLKILDLPVKVGQLGLELPLTSTPGIAIPMDMSGLQRGEFIGGNYPDHAGQ